MTGHLADLRRERRLSRERLARLSGVSARTIYRIEHQSVEPHLSTLMALAAILGCRPHELLHTTKRPMRPLGVAKGPDSGMTRYAPGLLIPVSCAGNRDA
jgi:transcriptional regulator with XRE-family HTH domain